MSNQMSTRIEEEQILVLERTFDAPRDLVFAMFKEPEHLKHWWGPNGWDLPVCQMDFRPGGIWHYCMKCMDQNQSEFYGMESWGKAVYKDIDEPEKIIYVITSQMQKAISMRVCHQLWSRWNSLKQMEKLSS